MRSEIFFIKIEWEISLDKYGIRVFKKLSFFFKEKSNSDLKMQKLLHLKETLKKNIEVLNVYREQY